MINLDAGGRATPLSNYKYIVMHEFNRVLTKPELRIVVRCRRKDFSFQQTIDAIHDVVNNCGSGVSNCSCEICKQW